MLRMEGPKSSMFTLFCLFAMCQLIFLCEMAHSQLSKGDTDSSNFTTTMAPTSECKKDYTCEQCVKIPRCYFCNTNANGFGGCQVYPAAQVFPRSSECPLSQARWGVCWVNFEALIIAMSVVGGVILLSVATCIYCCCCRGKSRRNDTHELKWERETVERQQRHADRRAEREAKMNTIRQKYGLTRDTATYNRMDE